MTPAAYHRICEPGRTSLFFTRLASVLIAAAMVPLRSARVARRRDRRLVGTKKAGHARLSG